MFTTTRERFRQWRDYRQAISRLRDLDDHLLADAGFQRRTLKSKLRKVIAQLARG
jgi:uncharacterized protein YjiS (DUF1127 family)